MPIPHLIHQFWHDATGQNRGIPKDLESNIQAWEETHPTFFRKTWSMDGVAKVLEHMPDLNIMECIEACRFPAMQSDIIRLALVYEFGGIWSDLKNKSLGSFLNDLCVIDSPFISEHPPMAARPEPVNYLCNALFGAPAKDPMIYAFLQEACKNVKNRMPGSVFSVTGGAVVMKIIQRAEKSGQPYRFHTLRYQSTWGVVASRTGASYNSGGQHWSERQKNEGLYI